MIFKTKKQKTILVVEDEENIRKIITLYLENWGFDCIAAENGENAIKTARNKNPDLIISDITIPGIDGLNLCRILKKDPRTKSIPIILLTGSGKPSDVDQGFLSGTDAYILKPVNWDQLRSKISSLLNIEILKKAAASS